MNMTDDELRSLVALHKSAAEAHERGEVSFAPAAYRAVALNRLPWLAEQLLAARATIAELKRFAIQCAHLQSDVVTGTSVANDVLRIIDPTAKGK